MENEQLKIGNEEAQKKGSSCRFLWYVVAFIVVGTIVGAVAFLLLDDIFSSNDISYETVCSDDVCSDVGDEQKVKLSSSDYISVVFDASPNKADCKAFVTAANRGSQAIAETENDLSLAPDEDFTLLNTFEFSEEKTQENILHLTIVPVLESIDGKGGTLAAAGPCEYNITAQLPIAGIMILDADDTDEFGKLGDVVRHEMMYVPGFGTAWEPIHFTDGSFPTTFQILEDGVFTFNDQGDLSVTTPSNNPKYT
eukprot:maker-scaffold_2-snap-gene-3.52-mRNA-1 protein AED:0.56 eAED:0.56 QI:0/0.33/0/1/1/1/4/0/252